MTEQTLQRDDLNNSEEVVADNLIVKAHVNSTKLRIVFLIVSVICVVLAITVISHARFSVFAGFCMLAAIFSALGIIVGNGTANEKLEVSEKFVLIRGINGKEMYLPIDSITAVGKSVFNTVNVTTHSCKMCCMFVENCDEIVDTVTRLVSKREHKV